LQGEGSTLDEFIQRFLLILFKLEIPGIQPPIGKYAVVVIFAIVLIGLLSGLIRIFGRIRNRVRGFKLSAIG
jgi:hypothetical protein